MGAQQIHRHEICNETLGMISLGNIGRNVADPRLDPR